eukprot:5257641-Amphidinium_carterae.2
MLISGYHTHFLLAASSDPLVSLDVQARDLANTKQQKHCSKLKHHYIPSAETYSFANVESRTHTHAQSGTRRKVNERQVGQDIEDNGCISRVSCKLTCRFTMTGAAAKRGRFPAGSCGAFRSDLPMGLAACNKSASTARDQKSP